MNTRRMRVPSIIAAAMCLALAASACTAAAPTPIYVHVTPTPAPSGTPTPVATPSPTPTEAPTDTPAAASSTPIASVAATATAVPAPTPTGPAGGCSGSASNQPFWVTTANKVPFTVYCGAVSSPWYFNGASSTYGSTGTVKATYATTAGAKIEIQEGAFCTSGASACSPHSGASLGSANFGDLGGTLYSLGPSLGFAIYVSPGTAHGYTATGTNVTQATFVSIVAALIKVPKS